MPLLLQLNATANWGSTGRIAEQIGQTVMRNGWESYIAFGRYENPSYSHTLKVDKYINVLEHYAENRLFDNEGLASRTATRKLIKKIDIIHPDIIHLHNIHDHWLNYKILFEYLGTLATPIVWTFHDCWAFTGGCTHFETYGCNNWKSECNNCPQKRAFLYNQAQRNFNLKKEYFLKPKNLTIVPVSKWMERLVKKSFFKDTHTICIQNGIDLDKFQPKENTIQKYGAYVLGVASKWSNMKGFDDFIQLRKFLPKDISIILIGLSIKQIKTLPQGIIGIQRTNNVEELASYYSNAVAFINPTYQDTFPTTNIETLACGTPVITYNTGGSPEIIDEHTGIVVNKGDIQGLKDAIDIIIKKGKSAYTTLCRQRAEQHFNKDICFQKYMELYESLISK